MFHMFMVQLLFIRHVIYVYDPVTVLFMVMRNVIDGYCTVTVYQKCYAWCLLFSHLDHQKSYICLLFSQRVSEILYMFIINIIYIFNKYNACFTTIYMLISNIKHVHRIDWVLKSHWSEYQGFLREPAQTHIRELINWETCLLNS